MSIRYLMPALVILIVTNVATAFLLVQRHSMTGYAEITFQNISADTIKSGGD